MAGGQVLINTNAALTGIREVSWRVCEWAGSESAIDALEHYSTALRSGLFVACTATRPRLVLWHFTTKQGGPEEALRAPQWREMERGGVQQVGKMPFAAARLLETAIANAIEARLLSQRSYVLLPPNTLAASSSLPLARAGPLGVGAGLLGTLGVEVSAFVQGDQLGIVAQVKRLPLISIRATDLKRESPALYSTVLVGRKAEEAVLLGIASGPQPGAQSRFQQLVEDWFPLTDTRLRVRLRSTALELHLPTECVWRLAERGVKDAGASLRRHAKEVLDEVGDGKAKVGLGTIKHSASTPALVGSGGDDNLPLLARSMPDAAQAAETRKRNNATLRDVRTSLDVPGSSSSTNLHAQLNAKRQRGDEDPYASASGLVLEEWLASVEVPAVVTPLGPTSPASLVHRTVIPYGLAARQRTVHVYHCPSAYAPVLLPSLPQLHYIPRSAKQLLLQQHLEAALEHPYAPSVDLTSLPPPPTLPIAHASKEEQPAREGKGEDEASQDSSSDSSSSVGDSKPVGGPSPMEVLPSDVAAGVPSSGAVGEEADREATQEEWLLGALVHEGINWQPKLEERHPTRTPTDAHVALTVTAALTTPPPLVLPSSPSSALSPPPPASFSVSLLVEHFFSSVTSLLPSLQLQTTPPLVLRYLPKSDDAELVPLEIPQLIAGYEEDWAYVPPSAVPVWEKAVLEPYSPAKDIIYYAVLLATPAVDLAARSFLRELSSMYEACRLGLHRPHDNEPYWSVERAANDGQQLAVYSSTFQSLTKNLLKSSLSYADSSFVIYIIHPFLRSAAAAAELSQLASEIVRECLGRNNLVNVAIQMLSTEEVQLRDALPLALKELAFSSFAKTRRVAFPHLPAKIYEPIFVLAPPTKDPKENTLHVGLARSEDGLWELCAVTDERGELLEVKPFLRTSFSPDTLRREIWSFATQFVLGARDVRWRVAVTVLGDYMDEEERSLWHETVLVQPKSDDVVVPLVRAVLLSCSIDVQMQFLPAGLAPEEPAQTSANPLHFAVFPKLLRRPCRSLDHAAPLLQAYVVSPAPVAAPGMPLPGEPSSVLSVVFYDFSTPSIDGLPPVAHSAPPSPATPAAAVAVPQLQSGLSPSDIQFARAVTRQLHRLSFLTTSPAWPNRASPLPFHLAVLQRLASLIRQTSNFAALASDP